VAGGIKLMMRVGFDVGPITQERTGVGNYCYYLLKHLLAMSANSDCELRGFSSSLGRIALAGLVPPLKHRHVPVPTRVMYKMWDILGAPKVDRLLGGVDAYHATNYYLPPTKRARRVVTIHDLAFLAVPELCSPKITGPYSKGIGRFAEDADAVLVYSESTKADIVNYLGVCPEKVTVAPMAVDEDFKPLARDAAAHFVKREFNVDRPFLLFVSTLEPRKNVPTLLRAFSRVAKDVPHNLVLVGSVGWNAEEIFKTLEDLNLSERIIRPGFVRHMDLPSFYCAADAFVFPTLYEGFGLPLLEALTCGCPVVTSDNSSVEEVTGGAALYSDAMDVEAIADGIRRVLEDSDLRDDLVARGLEHAKGFSWQSCAESTMEVYRRLAA